MAVESVQRKDRNPNIHYYQEAAAGAANAFYLGDLVQVDGSGELVIASSTNILGIAQKTATGTASTEIPVDVLSSKDEVSVPYKASATAEGLALDTVDFDFTPGAQVVDESGGSVDAVIIDHDEHDPWTTVSGRLIVRILSSALQTEDTHR
jgi:hypothetical protein